MPPKHKIALLTILLATCWGIGFKPGGDLNVYHQAAQWIASGKTDHIYRDNAQIGNFFYGPIAFTLLRPFGELQIETMNWIWLGLQTVAFLFFWIGLTRLFPTAWFLLAWVSSIKPIHASFQSHNVQLMFAAILVWAEIGSRQSNKIKQAAAGAVVVLLTAIKIYPGFIALYYLLRRPNPVRYGLLIGTALAALIPILTFGPRLGAYLPFEFVKTALTYHHVYDLGLDTVSLSLPSLLARWAPQLWLDYELIPIVVGIIAALFFVRRPAPEPRNWALALALMGLLNSTTRPDYFIFFVPAFCALSELRNSISTKVGIAISLLLIAFITEWTLQSRDLSHRLESWRVPVLGIMLLCSLLWFQSVSENLKRIKN